MQHIRFFGVDDFVQLIRHDQGLMREALNLSDSELVEEHFNAYLIVLQRQVYSEADIQMYRTAEPDDLRAAVAAALAVSMMNEGEQR